MEKELYYLRPGFEPNTLRVAELRNLLYKHEVDFPTSTKKPRLVELFNEFIAPKGAELLAQSKSVEPSDDGIIDAGPRTRSGRSISPIKRSARKPVAARTAEPNLPSLEPQEQVSSGSPSRQRKKRLGKPFVSPDEPEEELDQGYRRSDIILSSGTPSKKASKISDLNEDDLSKNISKPSTPRRLQHETAGQNRKGSSSPSNEFQSASDPLLASTRKTPGRKSQSSQRLSSEGSSRPATHDGAMSSEGLETSGTPLFYTSEKSDQRTKRKSFMPSFEDLRMSDQFKGSLSAKLTPPRQSSPYSQLKKEESEGIFSSDDDEQYRPEDFSTEESGKEGNISSDLAEATQALEQHHRRRLIPFIIWLVLLLSGAFLTWRNREKFKVGYCDVEVEGYNWSEVPNGDLWSKIYPSCEPCPSHAVCYPGFVAECEEGYIRKVSPLSFNGAIAIAPFCVPDTAKLRRVAVVKEEIITNLRVQNAKAVCGELKSDELHTSTIPEESLKSQLYDIKSPTLSDEEFEELWWRALSDVESDPEITESFDAYGRRCFQSTSLASISVKCAIKRQFFGYLVRHRSNIAGYLSLALVALYLKSAIKNRKVYNRRVNDLVQLSLTKLSKQQVASDSDAKGRTPRYIAAAQLRDAVLLSEPNSAIRKKLWEKVQKQVEKNTNVSARQMEIHGEIMRIWEWIGEPI